MQLRATTAIVGVALASAIAARPPIAAAQQAEAPALPVSVDRVRKALEKPPPINLAPRRPDFSVSVTDTLRYDDPFGTIGSGRTASEWEAFFESEAGASTAGAISLAAATASLAGNGTMSVKPLLVMDALAVAMAVEGKVRSALHNRKIRNVRKQVRRELEEFCAHQGCPVPD